MPICFKLGVYFFFCSVVLYLLRDLLSLCFNDEMPEVTFFPFIRIMYYVTAFIGSFFIGLQLVIVVTR